MTQLFKIDEIPSALASLSQITKTDVVEKLGQEPFKEAVANVLEGKNIREFTETLTRARLVNSYVETLKFFLDLKRSSDSLEVQFQKAVRSLNAKKLYSKEQKNVIRWLLGLTDKLSQNLLRDSVGQELDDFVKLHLDVCSRADSPLERFKIEITDTNNINAEKISLNGSDFAILSSMIGAQTLTIRGSEKSLHGKNFEKLILGTVFSLLGFQLVAKNTSIQNKPTFWLSSSDENERESDATLVFNGKGIRVDIGFIGRGNTEISLDKVSRYTRMLEIHGERYEMDTIIIVDRIGDRSRIDNMALGIQGSVLRMCDSDWVINLSKKIKFIFNDDTLGLPNNVTNQHEFSLYLKEFIHSFDISKLIS